jgi:tetratricopeptide (TPR) repeat protein
MMPNPYLNNWQRDLSRKESLILVGLFILLFVYYEYLLFSRLSAESYLRQGLHYSEEGRSTPKEMLIKKSLFYQGALKSFKRSLELNPYDARSYIEYGQIIAQIADDSDLNNSLDIGTKKDEKGGLYNLAKSYYEEAVLKEPANAVYHQRLGSIYDRLSETEKAEREFRKAVLLDPQNVTIHLYLSQYFLSKNQESNFLYHLDKVVQLYNASLRGGGPLKNMVYDFLKSINREDLIR